MIACAAAVALHILVCKAPGDCRVIDAGAALNPRCATFSSIEECRMSEKAARHAIKIKRLGDATLGECVRVATTSENAND